MNWIVNDLCKTVRYELCHVLHYHVSSYLIVLARPSVGVIYCWGWCFNTFPVVTEAYYIHVYQCTDVYIKLCTSTYKCSSTQHIVLSCGFSYTEQVYRYIDHLYVPFVVEALSFLSRVTFNYANIF